MDPTRFDTLTRALFGLSGHLPSRRALLGALGVGLVSVRGTIPLATEAKKRRKKRRKKKKCLFGQRRCRDKRCHGCCSDADCGGNVCELGVCSDCPRNQRLCRGGCIPEDSCCGDGECGGGQVCVDGACACRANEQACNGACIPANECCGTDCPVETCTPENCNGCCDEDACRTGDSANFCGRDGTACQQCDAGEACDAGVCHGGGGTCTPEDCDGCCDGDICREGDGRNFCGRGGAACVQCGRDASCNGEQCVCATGFTMCANGDCIGPDECCVDADCTTCEFCTNDHQCFPLCPTGCCHDDICEPGDTDEFCGDLGRTCDTCNANATCNGQFCQCDEGSNVCGTQCCGARACCPAGFANACCFNLDDCALSGAEFCLPAS